MNEKLTIANPDGMDVETRLQIVRELRELIDALDSRVPHVERVGEVTIARAAETLKTEALKRIDAIEREANAGPGNRGSSL